LIPPLILLRTIVGVIVDENHILLYRATGS